MASFETHDRQHYLRVYDPRIPRLDGREGQLWANASGIGPDEMFEMVPAGDNTFGLRLHEHFLSMQPDGRVEVNRTWLRSWERFRLVRGMFPGTQAIQSVEFGYMLCAEFGGGDRVSTRDYEAPAEWESFTARDLSVPPSAGLHGPIRRYGARGAGDDRGPQNWVGVSRFYHGHAMIHDRDRVQRDLDADVAAGYDYVRVMYQVGSHDPSDYWAGVVADHTDPRHRESVRWHLDRARERGMRVLATIIGKGNGLDRQSARRPYVQEMGEILRDYRDVVICGQIMNEPGIMGEVTLAELLELEGILRAAAPGLLTSTGEYMWADASWDGTGRTWGEVGTPHFDRDQTRSEGRDRPWRQPWDSGLVGKPLIDDEPIGPWSSVASEERPLVLRSHRAVAFICGCYATCYHPDAGIRGFGDVTTSPGYAEAPHAKRFLPPGIATGAPINANPNFPGRHWDLDSEYLRAGNGNTRGIVRAYGVQIDGRQYTIPFGPVSDYTLRARRAMRVECYQQDVNDMLWTRDVGQSELVHLSGAHPDYLLVTTPL